MRCTWGNALSSIGIACTLLLAGCDIDPTDGPVGSSLEAPADPSALPVSGARVGPGAPDFYVPPEPAASTRPGDLIWARAVAAPEGARSYALLYWSTDEAGSLVAVSAILLTPEDAAGAPRRIVGGGHGAAGLGDACAPSKGFFDGSAGMSAFVSGLLSNGVSYVESDYEGLGTPGPHPFAVARSAARNVLDSVRAAAKLTGGDADVVVVGHSQGGGAALMAAELQPTYAPELRLRGAVAVAPPSRMAALDDQLAGGAFAGYLLMSLHGLLAADTSLNARSSGLTTQGASALEEIDTWCADEILAAYSGRGEEEFGLDRVFDASDFSAALQRSEPGRQPLHVPSLVVHGVKDETIPVQNSRNLVREYCANGTTVEGRFVPDAGHVDVMFVELEPILGFVQDRLSGQPARTTCSTS